MSHMLHVGLSSGQRATDPQRPRRIDRIHATLKLVSLATYVYPTFATNSDHKAVLISY